MLILSLYPLLFFRLPSLWPYFIHSFSCSAEKWLKKKKNRKAKTVLAIEHILLFSPLVSLSRLLTSTEHLGLHASSFFTFLVRKSSLAFASSSSCLSCLPSFPMASSIDSSSSPRVPDRSSPFGSMKEKSSPVLGKYCKRNLVG